MTTAAPELIATKRRPATWYGIWAVVNTALGVLFAYPFLLLALIGLHARAMLFDRPDSPFSNNEIQGGEADGFIPLGIVAALVILAVLIGINLPLFRRLHPASGTTKAALTLLTATLLIAPSFLLW
ncbi:hypothetical protein GCM10009554_53440 [Kribbella koreensis]|uniref:Uncharacterized protein n=1 Tax=Kribbella koreensis TaxID=57909 RepID=A0ABP4BLP7_9ACTN